MFGKLLLPAEPSISLSTFCCQVVGSPDVSHGPTRARGYSHSILYGLFPLLSFLLRNRPIPSDSTCQLPAFLFLKGHADVFFLILIREYRVPPKDDLPPFIFRKSGNRFCGFSFRPGARSCYCPPPKVSVSPFDRPPLSIIEVKVAPSGGCIIYTSLTIHREYTGEIAYDDRSKSPPPRTLLRGLTRLVIYLQFFFQPPLPPPFHFTRIFACLGSS